MAEHVRPAVLPCTHVARNMNMAAKLLRSTCTRAIAGCMPPQKIFVIQETRNDIVADVHEEAPRVLTKERYLSFVDGSVNCEHTGHPARISTYTRGSGDTVTRRSEQKKNRVGPCWEKSNAFAMLRTDSERLIATQAVNPAIPSCPIVRHVPLPFEQCMQQPSSPARSSSSCHRPLSLRSWSASCHTIPTQIQPKKKVNSL